jgi:sulfoxide reductase heme-binding subunit YedZ
MTPRWVVIAKVAVWAACLAPFAWLFVRAAGFAGTLGADPVAEILDTCGKTGLNLLILTLCVTPLRRSTGINRLISFRRLLGLFAFFYLVLHFATYAFLDLGYGQWNTLLEDIVERPYITVGFTGLVLLVPLVVTSTHAMQRRLGRNWVKLHRLVYVVPVLGVVHYWWQVKADSDFGDPLFYAVLLAVLFLARLLHNASVHAKAAVAPANQRVEPPQAREKPGH